MSRFYTSLLLAMAVILSQGLPVGADVETSVEEEAWCRRHAIHAMTDPADCLPDV